MQHISVDILKNMHCTIFGKTSLITQTFNYRVHYIFSELCNIITHQAIELESLNTLWIHQVF